MDSAIWPPACSTPGTLHYIPPNLSAFEPTPPNPPSNPPPNILLWVGGMFDTHHSVAYPLSHLLPRLPASWSLHLASLSSAGKSWGVHTLDTDVADLSRILTYLTTRPGQPRGKVVIMGHSTGCQDCVRYVLAAAAPGVDGVVLQAPVSDREALGVECAAEELARVSEVARRMVAEGQGRDCLPVGLTRMAFGRMGITAGRWLDVASPGPEHAGADDLFSSDLGDERLRGTFGKLGVPMLVMHMGKDTGVPEGVDKGALIERWKGFVEEGGGRMDELHSGVVEGASHNLNVDPDEVVQDLANRVIGFLGRLERNDFGSSHGTSRI